MDRCLAHLVCTARGRTQRSDEWDPDRVARHGLLPLNWTLPEKTVSRTLLNGAVASRMISTAVFHHESADSEDTAGQSSATMTRSAAER